MVEHRVCSFCAEPIEPGTGMLFIKKDGKQFSFCSSKCRRNMVKLGRIPRHVEWTGHYEGGEAQ